MKKWMKAIATMMVLSMAMTGCGGSGDSADDAAGKYKVGIVQQLEHPALDAATLGFEEKLTELLTFANAAASIITTKKGALCVMPSETEIRDFIKK